MALESEKIPSPEEEAVSGPHHVFWPFAITKPEAEWTEFDGDYVGFMRSAYAEGFRPRKGPCDSVEAGDPEIREVCLVRRGVRNGWEPWLMDDGRSLRLGPCYGLDEHACVCIRPPFRSAAYFALEWLRGRPLEPLLADFEFVAGFPQGIRLRDTGT